MRISPIGFLTVKPNNSENKNKSYKPYIQQKSDYNLSSDTLNISFGSKKKTNRKKKVDRSLFGAFQKRYQQALKPPVVEEEPLPILEKYVTPLLDTVKYLIAKGSCLVISDDDIDSNEIFIKSLRTYIDSGQVKHLGFDKNKPFIRVNLADYEESSGNAYIDMVKDINKQIKGNQKPILLVSGVRALFQKLDRPSDFAASSIFKKYPTIFFVDQGYDILNIDEAKNFKLGFKTHEQRTEEGVSYFNEYEFKQTLSKQSFINNNEKIFLPSVNSDDAYIYLTDKRVQKQLLTSGKDVEFSEEAIPFAIALSKALKYHEDDYYNPRSKHRILGTETIPLNKTIEMIKCAVVKKLIQNPFAKIISSKDIIDSLPSDIDWLNLSTRFNALHNRIIKSQIEGARFLKEKSEKLEKADEKFAVASASVEKKKVSPPKDTPSSTDTPKSTVTAKKDKAPIESYFQIIKKPKTRFSDVGGLYSIKKEIKEDFLDILHNQKIKKSYIPSGILLSGPPGCGKTLLARAIAGEAGVPFISMPGSSFIEEYVGVGAKRVRALYEAAKKEAKKHKSKTAIVFIDEVDAVARSRKKSGTSEDAKTVNALLHELDGINSKEENDVKIVTIVATNYKGAIDEAFQRSGRIDLKYEIPDPKYSWKAREEILNIHAKDLPFKNQEEKEKIIHELALTTSGLSGADLAELLKKAGRMALNVNRKNNIITPEDIKEAKMRVLLGSKTDIEHTEYELKQTFAHEAGHAVASMIMEKIFENEPNKHKMPVMVLDFISNVARGDALGVTYYKPNEENKSYSRETCLANLVSLYGGYAIETEMFDTHSSGIMADLKSATEIVEKAVSDYDFGSQKRFLSLDSDLTKSLFREELKQEITDFAQKGMQISKKLIQFSKPFIEAYIQEFFKDGIDMSRTISAEEFKVRFNKWLNTSGKNKEYIELCKEVKAEIDEFCNEKDIKKHGIGFGM